MLDAPMPYLCGISREIFPLAVADISDETVVVDLDRNVITMGKNTPEVPFLPHRRKLKLEATLEKHAVSLYLSMNRMMLALVILTDQYDYFFAGIRAMCFGKQEV